MNWLPLLESVPRMVATEAIYYCMREVEGTDLDHLDQNKADRYTCELGAAGDELILRMEGFNRERGAELVRQLFHSEP